MFVPIGQDIHEIESVPPAVIEYVPTPQFIQALPAAAVYVPAGHDDEQTLAPAVL